VSVESLVFGALRSLVSDQVYPDVNDAGTAAPYIVYQVVGGTTPAFMENTAVDKEQFRVQVNVWHSTRSGARALSKQAADAMVGIGARPVSSAISLYDEDTKLRGASQDFLFWTDR
jgi:hypothetical protein